jgi:energy-coupling factor transport system ATP-binding protein
MALTLRGVSYRYAGAASPALSEVDLAVEPGEVLGIVGANDAGKSTLCLVASGLAPTVIGGHLAGEVTLDGESTRNLTPHDAATRCGILFQNPLTQLSGTAATVWEEVAFGPRNLGLTVPAVVDRVEAALDAVAIGSLAERHPEQLSGGQAQLVALAGVLALQPTTLVLDEPTSLLDPGGTRLIGDALARLARASKVALVIVEHKTDLLARLADRVVVLRGGRVVASGPSSTLFERPDLASMGVAAPAAVSIRRAAERDGVAGRLVGLDLGALADAGLPSDAEGMEGGAWVHPAVEGADAGPPAALEADAVEYVYPSGTRALGDVDLRIEPGQRVALIGQNGSGKSTLVRQFNGLLRPTRGEVRVNGRGVGRRHVAELAREVGLAFQNPDRQVFARRVRDEAAFGPRNVGLHRPELDVAVNDALAALGLSDAADVNPFDLGFSRRKLLSIASVLAMQTPIVILDEPTTGQDADGDAQIRRAVAALATAGRTVVTISHDMRFVAELFERVVVLREGSVVVDGPPAHVFDARHWPALASTHLEPPLPSILGARLGLGSTPTEAAVIDGLRQDDGRRRLRA